MKNQYRQFKKNSGLRRFATPAAVRSIKKVEVALGNIQRRFVSVQYHSRFRAVVHLGMQKTGSVWFREMLSDTRLYRYSGLPFVDCAGQKGSFSISRGIYAPIRVINEETLTFFDHEDINKIVVIRDPLALLISWINSTENYHVSGGNDLGMSDRRNALKSRDPEGKIAFALEHFLSEDRFEKTAELIGIARATPSATIVRYEDCLDRPTEVFGSMFNAADIPLPETELEAFVKEHSFESYSGRAMGSAAPKHSALQGSTSATVAQLGEDARSMVMNEVPQELRGLYEN